MRKQKIKCFHAIFVSSNSNRQLTYVEHTIAYFTESAHKPLGHCAKLAKRRPAATSQQAIRQPLTTHHKKKTAHPPVIDQEHQHTHAHTGPHTHTITWPLWAGSFSPVSRTSVGTAAAAAAAAAVRQRRADEPRLCCHQLSSVRRPTYISLALVVCVSWLIFDSFPLFANPPTLCRSLESCWIRQADGDFD